MALKLESVQDRYKTGNQWLKILVAGTPGAGKTLLASTFPNVLYADAEGRLLSVRNRGVKAVRVASSATLDELRAALAQKPEVRAKILGAPVDTVVLDTVDEIAKIIHQERLKAEKREIFAMGDWAWFGDTLRSLLRGFRNLPLNVLFNVHTKEEKDSETGRVWFKPDIQGAVGNEIAAYVDESFALTSRWTNDPETGNRFLQRYLQTYPDAQHSWLKDHSGTLPPEVPIDFQDDYQRLAKAIFGDVPSTISVPAAPSLSQPAPSPDPPLSMSPAAGPAPQATSGPAPPTTVSAPRTPANGNSATVEMATSVACADCKSPLDPVADELQIVHAKKTYDVALCRKCYVARKKSTTTTTG